MRIFPKVNLLPNEYDRCGGYDKSSKQIYIGYLYGRINPNTLLHEFIHYLIDVFTKNKQDKFHEFFHFFFCYKMWRHEEKLSKSP